MITHTPPKYHCDESGQNKASGCKTLREALWRVRPPLAVCGHIHEGRGAERILWDLDCPNTKFKESASGYWTDPSLGLGNKKQCYLDLSSKSPAPLNSTEPWINAYDGINLDGPAETSGTHLPIRKSTNTLAWTSATPKSGTSTSVASSDSISSPVLDRNFSAAHEQENAPKARSSETVTSDQDASDSKASEERHPIDFKEALQVAEDKGSVSVHGSLNSGISSATRGQGGFPPSGRCDIEALAGRRGRKETCVINAAIMASSWPYRTKGDRKYNKAIIVDIDLPVWQDSGQSTVFGE